jgi:hypothetical protein
MGDGKRWVALEMEGCVLRTLLSIRASHTHTAFSLTKTARLKCLSGIQTSTAARNSKRRELDPHSRLNLLYRMPRRLAWRKRHPGTVRTVLLSFPFRPSLLLAPASRLDGSRDRAASGPSDRLISSRPQSAPLPCMRHSSPRGNDRDASHGSGAAPQDPKANMRDSNDPGRDCMGGCMYFAAESSFCR